MNLYLEIFGYIGTALVLLSMMMTSVVKLRVYNTIGSVISMIYAFLSGAWPVVFLNLGLILINLWQLLRLRGRKTVFECLEVDPGDKSLGYFLNYHAADIDLHFPDYRLDPGQAAEVYMVYTAGEAVGVLVGQRQGDALHVELDYSTVKYRDCSVGTFLYGYLKQTGIRRLTCAPGGDFHNRYLKRMGFREGNGSFAKLL